MTSPAAPTTGAPTGTPAGPAPTGTPAGPTPNSMPGAQPNNPLFPAPVTPAPSATPPAAAPGATPPGPAPAAGGAPPQQAPWEGSGEPFDPQRAWNLIQNVRNENADLRGKLATAQPILDQHEQNRRAAQGELDTAREDLTKANARGDQWRDEAVRARVEALMAGRFTDPKIAMALVGDLGAFVDGDTIDTAKITARFEAIATEHPILVTAPPQQGFTPNRGQGQSGNGPLTPAQVAAHAATQQDWKTAGAANAQHLIDLRKQL